MADSPSIIGLKKLANDRLDDAKALLASGRNEGAVYLSGYSVELALKAKICAHLGWEKFDVPILRIHSLELLLRFTGLESRKDSFAVYWNRFSAWDPQMRYDETISYDKFQANEQIRSAEALLEVFL